MSDVDVDALSHDLVREGFIKLGIGSLATIIIALFTSIFVRQTPTYDMDDVLIFLAEDVFSLLIMALIWKEKFLYQTVSGILSYGKIETSYLKKRMILFSALAFVFWIFWPSYVVWGLTPQIRIGSIYIFISILKLHLWFMGLGLIYTCVAAIWRG